MIQSIREPTEAGESPDGDAQACVSISRNELAITVRFMETRLDQRSAPEFINAVNQVLQQWPNGELVLDFAQVLDMDNHGLTAIIRIFKTILACGRGLTICGINDRLQELFRITMLDQTLGTHYRPGQALH